MAILFSARTDVGRVREQNEDNFLVDRKLQLYVVCDGMGGHLGGEVASATAVNVVREQLLKGQERVEAFRSGANGTDGWEIRSLLTQAIQHASSRIFERGQLNPEQRGMGTTLSLMMLVGGRGFIGHVGDSRVYRMRHGVVEQLTHDHSLYNAMVASGAAIEGEALVGRLKNAVTRAVGVQETVEVDTLEVELEPGDRYLLCSDGLSGYIEDGDLERMLGDEDVQSVVQELVKHANARGGRDNITAIVIQMPGQPSEPVTAQSAGLDQLLRQSPLGRSLSDREVRTLRRRLDVREHAPGATIFSAGDRGTEMLLVVSGQLELLDPSGERRSLAPGDLLGEDAVVVGGTHSATLRVAGAAPAGVIALSREGLSRVSRDDPALFARAVLNLARRLAQRVVHATEALGDPLVRYGAPERPVTAPIMARDRRSSSTVDLEPSEIMEAESGARDLSPPPMPPPLPAAPAPSVSFDDDDEASIAVGVADTMPFYKLDPAPQGLPSLKQLGLEDDVAIGLPVPRGGLADAAEDAAEADDHNPADHDPADHDPADHDPALGP